MFKRAKSERACASLARWLLLPLRLLPFLYSNVSQPWTRADEEDEENEKAVSTLPMSHEYARVCARACVCVDLYVYDVKCGGCWCLKHKKSPAHANPSAYVQSFY